MKCRFAPSPTGKIHIGNARSAILNWIFCQKNQGEFVLRIDDTDQERSKDKYIDSIKEDLSWLGLNYDECYQQSNRITLYDKAFDINVYDKRNR